MSSHKEDSVHDKEKWLQEAQGVINDIKHHVCSVDVSKALPNTNLTIYLNLRTLEEKDFCVQITGDGFQVVGEKFDDESKPTGIFYETPYSLLNDTSARFKESFSNELISKLNTLANEQGE